MTLLELCGCLLKGQILFQRTHFLKAVAVRFLYHLTNHRIRCRYGRSTLSDIYSFGTQPFFGKIVRSAGTALYDYLKNVFAAFNEHIITEKHGYIRLDRISDHICDF